MQNTNRAHLSLSVARTVLEDIAAGRLAPGARVVEQAFSARCAVSRTPVREALALLKRHGAVRIAARHGACVAASPAAARKLLKARAFLGRHGAPAVEPAFVELTHRIHRLLADPDAFPEDVLKDAGVARALGVSRTTANRALALIAREGLLEPLPRRGWRRTARGPQAYVDWYEFRLAVEPAALKAAWPRFDREALRDLLRRTERAASPAGLARCSTAERIALDLELHRAIQLACANPFLKRTMEQAEAQLPAFMAAMPTWRLQGRSEATFAEHAEILRAILDDDRAAAAAALRRHLANAREHIEHEMRNGARGGA
ncbi:MAG: GntR family transcriptional regulator [Planctomycetota bacterium]|nr:GntR family transcriptional regulator [Planctomycetota bacterium]